jgi:hypothetical protein
MQNLSRFKPLKMRKKRSVRAFSLVTVLCAGLIGTMWIAGAYSMLVPLLQQSSAGKQSTMMRTLAETAVDFVSHDISNCMAAGQQSKYDDPEVGAPYTTFDLLPSQLGVEDSSNKNVRLNIIVKNEHPASEQDSATYDFQTVPSTDTKKQWSMVNDKNVGWRMIEVRVGLGSTASAKAIYRAMMRPDFGGISYGSGSGGDPSKSTYFPTNDAAFSTTALSVGSNSTITGNLSTNGSRFGSAPLSIAGSGITINGDVAVNSLSLGSDDLVAQGSAANTGTQPKIKGFVSTNGDAAGFDSSTIPDSSSVAVERPPNGAPNYNPDPSVDLISTKGSAPQTDIAPAPTAPAEATDLGAINLSGDAKLVIRDGAVDIPAGQSLANMTTGTASIPPGDYKISSMDVSGSSSILVGDGSTLSQPASFFVDNLSGGNSAVNIGGAGVSNSTSGNFQIWYNGTNNVTLSGVQATMAIYAPNARVTVSSKGSPINFKGAILGNNVAVSNANLTFETPTASTKNGSTSGQMMYDVTSDNGKSLIKPHGLKRILWQELNYSDYIKQGNAPF